MRCHAANTSQKPKWPRPQPARSNHLTRAPRHRAPHSRLACCISDATSRAGIDPNDPEAAHTSHLPLSLPTAAPYCRPPPARYLHLPYPRSVSSLGIVANTGLPPFPAEPLLCTPLDSPTAAHGSPKTGGSAFPLKYPASPLPIPPCPLPIPSCPPARPPGVGSGSTVSSSSSSSSLELRLRPENRVAADDWRDRRRSAVGDSESGIWWGWIGECGLRRILPGESCCRKWRGRGEGECI